MRKAEAGRGGEAEAQAPLTWGSFTEGASGQGCVQGVDPQGPPPLVTQEIMQELGRIPHPGEALPGCFLRTPGRQADTWVFSAGGVFTAETGAGVLAQRSGSRGRDGKGCMVTGRQRRAGRVRRMGKGSSFSVAMRHNASSRPSVRTAGKHACPPIAQYESVETG